MNSAYKTRQLTEGAIMAVITAVFALIGTFVPLLNTLTFLIIATPIIFLIVRNNLSTGILSSIVAAFLVGIIAGPIVALLFYIQFMFLALAYGYYIKKEAAVAKILTIGTLISVIGTILVFLLVMVTGQMNFEQQKAIFYESMDRTIEQYEEAGMLQDLEDQGYTQEEIREMLNGVIKFITNIIPTMLIIASAITAILNFIFTRLLLMKFKYKAPSFPKFSEWRMPWHFIWGFIAAWILLLFGDNIQNQTVLVIGQNILIAYGAAFFIMGLSTVAYIFKNAAVSPMMRVAFVIIIVFMFQSIVVITAIIGLVDMLFDMRQKIAKRKEEKK